MRFLGIIISFLLFIGGLAYLNLNLFAKSSVPPQPYGVEVLDENKVINGDVSSSLGAVVEKALEGTRGTYSFYIKNLETGEKYLKDSERIYLSASLYKLWVMSVVFEKLHNGSLKEEQVLSEKVSNLNDFFDLDEGFLELSPDDSIEISVKNAVYQMITISHNYSALVLLKTVGARNVSSFLSKVGLVDTTITSEPKTTAADVGLFFEKLYKNEIVNPESSEKMIEILKNQKLNEGIPKYLPDGVEVAHKTGDLDFFKHDGGIVFTSKGDFIIVALSESDSPLGAQDRIAKVSKAVYEYFVAN